MKPRELKIDIIVDTTEIKKCKSLLCECYDYAKKMGLRKKEIRKYFKGVIKEGE